MPTDLYPAITPHTTGMLPVGDGHELYYEESGNPNGIPVVYLHGGPGGGSAPWFHQIFDPARFRIVVFDQRGAGSSTPFGETKNNSPDHLIEDTEKLREHLGIKKWHVFGGSWGSTLALLYAEAHPEATESLTLRGIFLMRQKELDFLYKSGSQNYPNEFAALRDYIPAAEQGDLLQAYYNRISAGDVDAAINWTRFEVATSYLVPPSEADLQKSLADKPHTLGMAIMETHFFVNHRLTPDDRILQDIGRIRHIPTMIVQGQYDSVCAPENAWDLKRAFPEAHLQMVISGHSAKDPATRAVLVESADRIRDTGRPTPPQP